jgi:hypothetical protein
MLLSCPVKNTNNSTKRAFAVGSAITLRQPALGIRSGFGIVVFGKLALTLATLALGDRQNVWILGARVRNVLASLSVNEADTTTHHLSTQHPKARASLQSIKIKRSGVVKSGLRNTRVMLECQLQMNSER